LRWAGIYWTTAWVRIPLRFAYDVLAVMFSLSWVIDRSRTMLRAILIAGLLAFPLYIIVPACGPTYAFAGYPLHPIVPSGLAAVAFGTPRNCFPSLHVTWALVMMLNAQSKAWRTVLLAYLIAVGFATVGTGEHYVIDVIAAVPFTFAVQWLVERASVRRPVGEATSAVWNHPAIRGVRGRTRVERSTD
jgi:membrane-associated phospholipid phosphatase